MKQYTIIGGSFRMDDGSIKQAGEVIELADDIAAMHAHNLQAVQTSEETPAADADHQA